MRIALDTSGYTVVLSSPARFPRCLQEADRIYVPTIVLGELYAGFGMGTRREENMADLRDFLSLPGVEVTPVTHEAAERYGALFGELKRQGTLIPTNDIWIAATALEAGARLLSCDAHFDHVPGLIVLAP